MTKIEWTNETWNPVTGYEGYHVTLRGQIRGPSGKIMKQMEMPSGHLYVLCNQGRGKQRKLFVHRAILLAFVGEPEDGQETRHLDGNPAHNHLNNLLWGNRLEQRADDRRHGVKRGRPQKLTADQALKIRNMEGIFSSRRAASMFGLSHTTVLKIWRKKIWAQI